MKKLKDHTIEQYFNVLSARTPTPGGGSASALTAAAGVSLLIMVANYSVGKTDSKVVNRRLEKIIKQSKKIRDRLIELIDLDAEVYRNVVESRKSSANVQKAALRQARKIPLEVARLCYKTVSFAPYLVEKGNSNLISDVQIAVEMLFSSYTSAMINVEINQ